MLLNSSAESLISRILQVLSKIANAPKQRFQDQIKNSLLRGALDLSLWDSGGHTHLRHDLALVSMGYICFHRWDTVLRSNDLLRYQQGIPGPLLFTHYGKEKEHQGRRSSLLPQFLTQKCGLGVCQVSNSASTMISTFPPPLFSSCQAHPHILPAPQFQTVRK